jgi:ABC-type branched-subunit amino acid transport system substrate-binding protein
VGIDRNAKAFDEAAAQVMAGKPDCVVYTTNAGPALRLAKQLDAVGFRGIQLSSSFAGQELVEGVAGLGRTFILSTVVPRPTRVQFGVVKQCQDDLASVEQASMGLTTLEGYIAGRVAVAAVLAGKTPATSRAQLLDSLANLHLDLGGYTVNYTGGHRGSDYVDVISVDREGRMIG